MRWPWSGPTLEDSVDQTMEVLDEMVPDWVDRMPTNLHTLDVSREDRCVLLHAFGNYWRGRRLLSAQVGDTAWRRVHYEVLAPYARDRDRVNEVWRDKINYRRVDAA